MTLDLSAFRRYALPDDWEILVGKTARDNDRLSLKVAHANDFWFHVAGMSGSHVVARHPERPTQIPRDIKRTAAGLAVFFSKAREAGKTAVHWTQARHVSKPRGAAPGKVQLQRFESLNVQPLNPAILAQAVPNN